jgi:hypothetical protein
MTTQTRSLGKTRVVQSFPWGLYNRSGHRLLCSDGIIRAAELSASADTFFSVPAKVRVKGRWISGYMTCETADGSSVGPPDCYSFRRHTCHADALPEWPRSFTDEHRQLIAKAAS